MWKSCWSWHADQLALARKCICRCGMCVAVPGSPNYRTCWLACVTPCVGSPQFAPETAWNRWRVASKFASSWCQTLLDIRQNRQSHRFHIHLNNQSTRWSGKIFYWPLFPVSLACVCLHSQDFILFFLPLLLVSLDHFFVAFVCLCYHQLWILGYICQYPRKSPSFFKS